MSRRSERTLLAAIVAGAAMVRLWLLTTPAMRLDGDEAVTGILARRILDGHHSAFFPGQDYMGTAEQYAQAGVLAVLPDTAFVLRLPQVALGTLACLLVYALARQVELSSRRALLAAAMFAAGPYFLLYWGSKSRGAYGSAMVLGLVGLLLALSTEPTHSNRPAKAALFGFVVGLAFWLNQQAAYVLLPAAWWLWASLRDRPGRHAAVFASGFLAGALPILWRGVASGRLLVAGGGESGLSERVPHVLFEIVPDFLGLRDDDEALVGWLPSEIVGIVAIAALGAVVFRRRHGLARFLALKTTDRDGVDLLLFVVAWSPLLLLAAGGSVEGTARFLFVVYPALFVLLAAAPIPRRLDRPLVPAAAGGLAVLALLGHTWLGSRWYIAEDDGGRPVRTGQRVVPEDVDAVVAALHDLEVDTAYADYWLAHVLNWHGDGKVPVESVYQRRFPHLSAAVRADPSPALIVSGDEIGALRHVLDQRGVAYQVAQASGWWIVHELSPGIHFEPGPTIVAALGPES